MAHIDGLLVWQLASELREYVQDLAGRSPVRDDFRFCSQFQDSASGVSRNIAEGYGRRRAREFSQFLIVARGSLAELEDHLTEGVARKHWTEQEIRGVRVCCRRTRGAIDGLIRYLRTPEAATRGAAAWDQPRGRPQ